MVLHQNGADPVTCSNQTPFCGVLSCVPNKKINLYKTNYRCKIYVIKNTNYKILVKLIKYKIMVEIYKLKMYKNRYIK